MPTTFPECVVCNSPFRYKERQPYLLPCLHAVCSVCLDQEIGDDITCSICQRSHDKRNQSFPVDHVVLAEVLDLTAQHRPSEISCTNKEDGNQAVCWCEECNDFLCEHCQISHGEVKISRNHKLREMSEFSQTLKRCYAKCITHALAENIYDKDCDSFICNQCFYNQHANHLTVTFEELATFEDIHLKDNLGSVSEKKDEVLQSCAAVDAHANILGDTSSRLRETVQHTFSELRSLLDQREKVILLELDQLMECMNTTNNSRRPVLKGIETSCQATLDYINKCLMYAPPQHLYQLKSSIQTATQFCKTSDVSQVHEHEASVTFSKQGLQDLRTRVSSFGSFLAPVDLTRQPDEFSSFHSVKMKLLETTIEGLRKQTTATSQEMKTLTDEVSKRGDQIHELENERKTLIEVVSKKENEIQEHEKTKKTLTDEVWKRGDQNQELEETNGRLQKVVQQVNPEGLTKGSFLHLIKSDCNRVFVVKCPKMTFNENRVNLHRVRIDGSGALINDYNATRENAGHLQKYCGTSATSALPSSGLVYWEVEADVNLVDKVDSNNIILEIAVCDEDVMDVSHYVGVQSKSCSLYVAHSKGDACICLCICENGIIIENKINFFPNEARVVRQLKFGILFDGKTKKVTFIDVADMKILGQGPVSLKSRPTNLWPMFAPFRFTKKMKLVSGENIKMSHRKTNVLSNVLSAAVQS